MEIRQLQMAFAENKDEQAYKRLFILLYTPAIRFSTLITKNEEAAEEIYSDAMMKLWFMGDKLNEINNLKTYLFVILKNSSLNYLKKNQNIPFISIDDINTDHLQSQSAEDYIHYKELNELLTKVINSLPPKCLMVYRLVKDEGFTYKQTAEILGLSINTIEGHMQNALQKINRHLKRSGLSK